MSIDLGNKISLLTFSIALAEHFYAVRRLLLPWKFCTVIIAITVINLFLRCCQCTQPLIYVMLALFVELFKDFLSRLLPCVMEHDVPVVDSALQISTRATAVSCLMSAKFDN